MSTRTVLQSIIDSNVYDNSNKEILASMLRTVLEELMNSDFNKDDDQLENLKYNSIKTLAQQFALLPIIQEATVGPFNVGGSGSSSLDVTGVAASAIITSVSNYSEVAIIFPSELNITEKKILFNWYSSGFSRTADSQVSAPVYYFFSPTQMNVCMRELSGEDQSIYLKILII